MGRGVDVADYERLRADAGKISAELCATRKVTDVAAMPRGPPSQSTSSQNRRRHPGALAAAPPAP